MVRHLCERERERRLAKKSRKNHNSSSVKLEELPTGQDKKLSPLSQPIQTFPEQLTTPTKQPPPPIIGKYCRSDFVASFILTY